MKMVGAYEAKTHLPRMLEEVTRGESFTITKHGRPVAVLRPIDPGVSRDREKVIEELRRFRRNKSLKGLSIREMISEGRR